MKVDNILRGALALIAVLFGALTIFAGSRVLGGSDPGYAVFRPLVIYNTLMGAAYVAAGAMAWRSLAAGRVMAGAIFALNVVVLSAVAYLYKAASAVAIDSVQAMTLRTVVWLALFVGFAWLSRRNRPL